MAENELLNAMQFGSSDPKAKRPADDLGRFGLGLKTASISQCRRFTVLTRKSCVTSACVWDHDSPREDNTFKWEVDLIDEQQLANENRLRKLLDNRIGNIKSGTV